MQMDRAIFDLNLNVEATSLYILTCALLDQGESPTLERIRLQWNGNDQDLSTAVQELLKHNVVTASEPIRQDEPLKLNPRSQWSRN